ncbi:MAG: NADH-quinone oxidoreductase subunit NuoG [Ferrimicrobium sp.]
MPDERVKLTIDGTEVVTSKGTSIIAAAEEAGVYIPRFCYHSRLKSVGVCRMCLVDVKGPRGFSLQPACYVSVAEGMEVLTESDKVKKAQHGVLEFLLANHPLDCPVCDKGGECPLQDQAFAHGSGETRFIEEKRHYAKPIAISSLVNLDRERCIQCDRCTRFADEVAGEPLIDFAGRGNGLQISTFVDVPFDSYFSGNTVQICPVGALTAKPYRFKARPWDISQAASTCATCGMGCQLVVQSSGTELTRTLGVDSDAVNQSWLCDRGRFGFAAVNARESRLSEPQLRRDDRMQSASWSEALGAAASEIRTALHDRGRGGVGLIGAASVSNESAYAWAKLFVGELGSVRVDGTGGSGFTPSSAWELSRGSIDEVVAASTILIVDCDPKEDLPVLYLRLRQAAREGHRIVELASAPTSMSELATRSVHLDPAAPAQSVREVLDFIGEQDGTVSIIAGRMNRAISREYATRLLEMVTSELSGSPVLSGVSEPNFSGVVAAGLAPGVLPGARGAATVVLPMGWSEATEVGTSAAGIIEAAEHGELGVLVLLDTSFEELGVSPESVSAIRSSCSVVLCARYHCVTAHESADVVLPIAAWGEEHGSIVNIEGRLLRLGQQVSPMGLSKPAWMVAAELANSLGRDLGFVTVGEVSAELHGWGGVFAGLDRDPFARTLDGPLLPVSGGRAVSKMRQLDPMATPGIGSAYRQGPNIALGKVLEPTHALEALSSPMGRGELSSGPVVDQRPREDLPTSKLVEGSRWLITRRRLYDRTPELDATPFFEELRNSARVLVSARLAEDLDANDGDMVSIPALSDHGFVVVIRKDLDDEVVVVESDATALGRLSLTMEWPQVAVGRHNG